jgi:hypothetical protein
VTLFAMVRRLSGKRDGVLAVLLLSTYHIPPGPAFAKYRLHRQHCGGHEGEHRSECGSSWCEISDHWDSPFGTVMGDQSSFF